MHCKTRKTMHIVSIFSLHKFLHIIIAYDDDDGMTHTKSVDIYIADSMTFNVKPTMKEKPD